MSRKRPAPVQDLYPSERLSVKKAKTGITLTPGKTHIAPVRYRNHRASGVGEDYHSVPYPLSLMPYDSWYKLHHQTDTCLDRAFACPKCKKLRSAPTAHQQKLFLVAERLTWEEGKVPMRDITTNEEQLWEVNFQLGIMEPSVEDHEHVPGGKQSRKMPFFPFETEDEMEVSMKLLEKAERLSEDSFHLWRLNLDAMPEVSEPLEDREKPQGKPSASRPSINIVPIPHGLPSPPSSLGAKPRPGVGSSRRQITVKEEKAQEVSRRMALRAASDPGYRALLEIVRNANSRTPQKIIKQFTDIQKAIEHEVHEEYLQRAVKAEMAAAVACGAKTVMFDAWWSLQGQVTRERRSYAQLPDVIRNRLDELALKMKPLSASIKNILAGTSAPRENKVIQSRISDICIALGYQRQLLEQEAATASAITHVAPIPGWQRASPPTALSAGEVEPLACHLMAMRSLADPLINRLLHRVQLQRLTWLQRGLFWDMIALHQWYAPLSNHTQAGARSLYRSRMISLNASLVHAFQDDPLFRLTDRNESKGLPVWGPLISTIARERLHQPIQPPLPPPQNTQSSGPARHQNGPPEFAAPPPSGSQHSQTSREPSVPVQQQAKEDSLPPLKARKPLSITTLPTLYTLLDKIEKTSYVASRYLATYAEFLNRDVCVECWHNDTILEEDDFAAMDKLFGFFCSDSEDEDDAEREEQEGEEN